MGSIATTRGDAGQTGLAGGIRVSKASLRVNRLSDLLWLFGRKLERDAGVSGSLRAETGQAGNRWSRAW
jgi:cob(I)alamin adenosyltransferase